MGSETSLSPFTLAWICSPDPQEGGWRAQDAGLESTLSYREAEASLASNRAPQAERNPLPPPGLYHPADPAAGDLGCRGYLYLLVSGNVDWHLPGISVARPGRRGLGGGPEPDFSRDVCMKRFVGVQ